MRRLLAALALIPACAPAGTDLETSPVPPSAPRGGALEITARAVDISPGKLTGIKLLGTVSLSADHRAFGGFSGLEVADGHIYAVGDAGWFLAAPLIDTPQGIRPGPGLFEALMDLDGAPLGKAGGDAEGFTRVGTGTAISFERDHRIVVRTLEGRRVISDRRFEKMRSNSGLEALAALPDTTLLAIGEKPHSGAHPVFVISPEGAVAEGALPEMPPFSVTGADMGPDGKLYVLFRNYNPLAGVSIQVQRMSVGANGVPDPATRQTLAAYQGYSRIDNMEGISVWQDAQGRTRIALISDDNFNVIQRTLLMDFVVAE